MDEDKRRILRWTNRLDNDQTVKEVESILQWKKNPTALDMWYSFAKQSLQIKDSARATLEIVLDE